MSATGTLISCSLCGKTYLHGWGHKCGGYRPDVHASKPWDMEHVNRVNVPPDGEALGFVVCPTEGCSALLEQNGPCYRCGWTLIVTRKAVDSNAKE
jgi:hypothetical protein